ncbi:MAG: DUF4115 domain-containing protein [Deltaproteobacteria bacterium]|nr:DUF4115 domain-containing protein [Deltaproteobacteria bacterium]
MAEKNQPESPSLESLGQFLSEEREKAGLTRSDLASRTKIAIDEIVKMEEGRFSHLPPVYARGFLKTMAWALNLDPEILLGEYRRLSGNKEGDPTRPLTSKKYVDADLFDEGGSSLGLSVILILVIVAAGTVLFFLNPSFRQFVTGYLPFLGSSAPAPAAAPPAAAPDQAPAPAPAAAAPAVPAAPAAALPREGGELVLSALKATWSQILVDSEPLQFYYFQPGQSQSFKSRQNVTVMAGDGQALRVRWNGQDLGFLGPAGPLELVFPPRP